MRFIRIFLFSILIYTPLHAASQICDNAEMKLVARQGQSALYKKGDIKILLLQGTPYQIGYAHGKLLAKDVAYLVDRVMLIVRAGSSMKGNEFTTDTIEEIYRRTLPYIPARYREELRGLADGAGLDFHSVELANLFPEMFHCSGFALMNKATKDGKLIHGRVLDYMTEVGIQNQAVVMVVKAPGCNTIMLANYTGFVGCVTGMNDRQIGIGEMGMYAREQGHWDGVPMTYMLRQILEEYDNLPQIENYFIRSPRTCEYAYVVSDAKVPDAIGVHAVFDKVQFLKPGESHPLLPTPVPDTILISASDRYKTLVEKVRENYGKFDVEKTIEIIKRPLAMQSNLHDAIMVPADHLMYLANAINPEKENFQACYQTYYKHDLNEYSRILDDLAKNYKPTTTAAVRITTTSPATAPTTQPAGQSNAIIEGTVPASLHRPMKPAADTQMAALLKRFDVPAVDFKYQKKLLQENNDYKLWKVTFPSPVISPDPENNTVWCEYFESKTPGPKQTIIVLHILENDFTLPRIICHTMASSGMNAMLVKMAYYGERRPKDPARQKSITKNVDTLLNGVCQTVTDVRRAAEFLASQNGVDPKQIGICGVSLGALVGSLTIGVDGNFPKAAIILGGADLASVITSTDLNIKELRDCFKANGLTEKDQIVKTLVPIEPLTYLSRAQNTDVLLINAKDDKIIPVQCTQSLVAALPHAKIQWFNAGHNSMIVHFVTAIQTVIHFFQS
jgi:cephalosporin-C deacetylase-like acetyl esterase